MRKRWTYRTLHIPFHCDCLQRELQTFLSITTEELTLMEFLLFLAQWNRAGAGHWQYWSEEI